MGRIYYTEKLFFIIDNKILLLATTFKGKIWQF